LLESSFCFNVLFLKFGDQIVFELHLLKALVILGVGLRSFDTVLLFVFLQLMDELL